MLTPFQKAFAEIDLLNNEGIQMPNGVLNYDEICYGEFKKVDSLKVNKIKSILST